MTTEVETSTSNMTASEMLDSLTGFDEIAIEQHFGYSVNKPDSHWSDMGRMLIFVDKRRQGLPDKVAKQATFELNRKQIEAYFRLDDEDADETAAADGDNDAPGPDSGTSTESGKDDSNDG